MPQVLRAAVAVLCFLLMGTVGRAQDTPPPTPQQLAAMERVRPLVDAIWKDVRGPKESDQPRPRYFSETTDKLIAIGPDAVPFLTTELELMDPATFHFCAYSLGRLGGPDAEAALRKAVRAADARGGKFGAGAKRFALYGLAVLGAPDVMDLLQTGESMHFEEMLPDLPLVTQLALMVGPPAAPLLEKQLATYSADPAAAVKLEDTLLGLGRVGKASSVPKLTPLLSSSNPEVRALAADAISRLGPPSGCEPLLPMLSSTDIFERRHVAKTFERWKPEPCYKGMVGRLEVEGDIAVRGPLYNAIVALGGESALDVLRLYLQSTDQFDQALVIIAVGQVGSKKGLNLLRPLLSDERVVAVVRSLQSIGVIGGEGAIDTLLASTSDPRFNVATAALDSLTAGGVKKVAPRVASELLSRVHDPVGDLSMRAPIAGWGDALVKFGYTDPIDDLAAAAAVQTDPDIKESLNSCVRRLQLIAKNKDDVAAWATALAAAQEDVRRLAERRLAEIGSPAAVRAIAKRLAATDLPPDERAKVLLALAEARTAGAAELVEHHLSDPAYDTWEQRDVRAAAAYAALRIGGDRMTRAVRTSAVRRDGQDWATLVYLALLDKGASLSTLKTLRVHRLRYPDSTFGHQEWLIDGIIADVAAGREPIGFNVPPEELFEK